MNKIVTCISTLLFLNLVTYVVILILGKDKMVLVVGARGPGHGWRPQ